MCGWERDKTVSYLTIGMKCIRLMWHNISRCTRTSFTTTSRWRGRLVDVQRKRRSIFWLKLRMRKRLFINTRWSWLRFKKL